MNESMDYRFMDAPYDEEVTVTAGELKALFFRTVQAVEIGAQRRSEGFWYLPEAHIQTKQYGRKG